MSIESNKWLHQLNEVNRFLGQVAEELGYEPEELTPGGSPMETEDALEQDLLREYHELLKRKKFVEKKLEDALSKE